VPEVGCTEVRAYLPTTKPTTKDQVQTFLAADPVGTMRQAG